MTPLLARAYHTGPDECIACTTGDGAMIVGLVVGSREETRFPICGPHALALGYAVEQHERMKARVEEIETTASATLAKAGL